LQIPFLHKAAKTARDKTEVMTKGVGVPTIKIISDKIILAEAATIKITKTRETKTTRARTCQTVAAKITRTRGMGAEVMQTRITATMITEAVTSRIRVMTAGGTGGNTIDTIMATATGMTVTTVTATGKPNKNLINLMGFFCLNGFAEVWIRGVIILLYLL